MTIYYNANLMHLTPREYWRRAEKYGWFHRPILSALFLVAKLIRVPHLLEFCSGQRVDELIIPDPETVPPALTAAARQIREECPERSLEVVLFCRYDGPDGPPNSNWEAALLSGDGLVYAELACDPKGERITFSCFSRTDPGITIHTTNKRVGECWSYPPFFDTKTLSRRRSSYRDVVERHYDRIGSHRILPLEKSSMPSYITETSNLITDYWIQRGVYEVMNQEELDKLYGRRPTLESE